jgi:hypothetical protein
MRMNPTAGVPDGLGKVIRLLAFAEHCWNTYLPTNFSLSIKLFLFFSFEITAVVYLSSSHDQ